MSNRKGKSGKSEMEKEREMEKLKRRVMRLERVIVRQDEEIRELKRKARGQSTMEDYTDSESGREEKSEDERKEINNNERKSSENEGEEKEKTEDMDKKERRLVIRKRIAFKGKYVETWMKERTGKDYNQWALEEVEEKLLETMKGRGEKEFTVEKFISAEERWKMKRHTRGKERMARTGYKGRDHKRGHWGAKRRW
ncbi:hypothetical protein QAD02_021455 [Eretmocerus hayati]|uniref:Uncharacterized protein n=1 Tax=Eretmocerus hayati TaxID=131215 RepID=A0ACC2PTG0_9HYME|nr:hypothetical protein QAD02_021455 [Eretmocerus hayati]